MEFSSSDENILDLVYLAKFQKRQFWIHPLRFIKRKTGGTLDVIELHTYPDRFENFYKYEVP